MSRSRSGLPEKFGIGRPAPAAEITKLDIDVRSDGKGLPAGAGNTREGKLIYEAKCVACHGNGQKLESPLPGEPLFVDYPLNEKSARAKSPVQLVIMNEAKKSKGQKNAAEQKQDRAPKTIGTYWPYATTIFDYVRRAMPYNAPGSLTNQEVYHLTAYLLYRNHIISQNTIITEKSLPKIVMPAKEKYVNDDRKGGKELK
ncbi:MAG: c-type cytochrome [Pedobacter sp.]|uniref:c-type cytochrome n=1 Tax=Pedobacter sp. TaxID=1411316 RepID=UPI0033941C42